MYIYIYIYIYIVNYIIQSILFDYIPYSQVSNAIIEPL